MTTEDRIVAWVQALSALSTFVSIVCSLVLWYRNIQYHRATDKVGPTALDQNKIGPFTVRWPRCGGNKACPPILPTLSTIIKAGDMHVFTSSMFDGLSPTRDEVSWRTLYEAFLEELVWREMPASGTIGRKSKVICGTSDEWKPLEEAWGVICQNVNQKLKIRSDRSLRNLDRHLLYPRFRRRSTTTIPKKGERHGDHSSNHAFDGLAPSVHGTYLLTPTRFWATRTVGSMICNKFGSQMLSHPKIKLVSGEPGASDRAQSLEGDGIFGRGLYGQASTGDSWYFRLSLNRLEHSNEAPSKSSGYSILFAKCMACGCTPFETSDLINRVVFITPDIHKAIKDGHDVEDGWSEAAKDKTESTKGQHYLIKLPSANRISFYARVGKPNQEGVPAVCSSFTEPIKKWPEVVAGIAFGGLVPMATLNLTLAIRFTAKGGKELGDTFFSELWNIMITIQNSTQYHQLFGQYIEDCSKSKEGKDAVRIKSPEQTTMAKAAASISHFSTILEYITARSANFEIDSQSGVDEKLSPTQNTEQRKSDRVRSNVFDSCCRELSKSYGAAREAAVVTSKSNKKGQGTVAEKLKALSKSSFDAATCGKIARYIILAWTYYVTIVVWNDEGEKEATKELDFRVDRIYHPVDLKELPRSCFLT